MKETQLLGTLLPSHPDFIPIIQAIRDKYKLPEISPDDDPITEIFLGDEIVPLEVFRQDIEDQIRENLDILPPETAKLYKSLKGISKADHFQGLELLPKDLKKSMEDIFISLKNIVTPITQLLDAQIKIVAGMLYIYLLTGESEEVPSDWISNVSTIKVMGEPMVMAVAGQIANPDVVVQRFREEYNKKTFGAYHPKITETATSTVYFLQLKKIGKPWNFIVEEYIRLNKFSLPRDRSSKRYFDTRHLYEQRLKKRIQRTETIFEVLIRDIK